MSPDGSLPSGLSNPRKHRIAAAYCATYVLLGLMLTCIGPSLDALRAQTGSTTGAIAVLFTANALGYIGGSLLAGRLYARLPGHRVLAAALLGLALLTSTLPWLRSLETLAGAFALVGVPLGVMDVGGNTLLVWLYGDDVPPFMNALHLSFGVGALLGPLAFDRFAVATGNAADAFWLFAACMVPVAAWLAAQATPDSPAPASGTPGRSVTRSHAWLIGLIAAFFFLHMGGELAFGGWIYTYAGGATGSETTARLVNSTFWGGLVAGRLVAVPLALRLSPRAMLQLDLLGALASLAVIVVLPGSIPALWIGTLGFGFSIASMASSSFNLAARRVTITSQVSAAFLVGGSLGSMTLPWLVGQLFVPYGPLAVMEVAGIALLAAWGLLGLILAVAARSGENGPAQEGASGGA